MRVHVGGFNNIDSIKLVFVLHFLRYKLFWLRSLVCLPYTAWRIKHVTPYLLCTPHLNSPPFPTRVCELQARLSGWSGLDQSGSV